MMHFLKLISVSAALSLIAGCLPTGHDSAAAGEPAAAPSVAKPATAPKRPLAQAGPWYPLSFNLEEPYINIVHASSLRWNGGGYTTQQLLDEGYIDKATGLPIRLPKGKWLESDTYFSGNDVQTNLHWDGEWVLEWEGDADLWILYLPNELQWRVSKNRIEFTRDFKRGKSGGGHNIIQVRRLNGPLKNLRLYRKENEAALRAGKIYNPKLVAAVSRYDIVRTMDLQLANSSVVRSVDDLPGPGAPFWGNMAWQFETRVHQPYRSMPLEAVVALAMETDTALWACVPITLGNPDDFFSDEFRNVEATDKWAGAYRAKTRENIDPVLDSPEWDRYADRFVSALIEQGYPEDRAVYVTVANEVWNFAWQYFHTTQYAWGVGEALKDRLKMSDGNYRQGYGVITARWKLALDAALARAGRKQPVIYVIESQAAWADTTSWALEGVKSWLEFKGERWEDHAGAFGVSIASYWGDEGAFADARETRDPAEFNRLLKKALIDGHPKSNFSRPKVVKLFHDHAAKAKAYGVPIIGAYEGGSHLERPKDVSEELYDGFMWGEDGAAVNRAVNDALAAEFPGIILSNYVLAGPTGGQPWFEGFYGATNPYARSWEAYMRPAPAGDGAGVEE